MQSQSQDEQERRMAVLPANESFADIVVKAASACNRVITEHCGLCTLYCDKQVQYESAVMEQYVTGGSAALSGLFQTMDMSPPEVKDYKDMLFDEQSVVQSVSSRQED